MLIEAIEKRIPPPEYCELWERTGLVRFIGDDHRDEWEFVAEALDQLAYEELVQLYAETKARK